MKNEWGNEAGLPGPVLELIENKACRGKRSGILTMLGKRVFHRAPARRLVRQDVGHLVRQGLTRISQAPATNGLEQLTACEEPHRKQTVRSVPSSSIGDAYAKITS